VPSARWSDALPAGAAADCVERRSLIEEGSMTEQAFDAFTRSVGHVATRRSSLLALGGAALAAGFVTQVGTEAKQKPAKKIKKKNKKKCNQEIAECRTLVLAADADPATEAAILACCENCFAGDFLTCFLAAVA
jgi:hypothetical protein